MIVKFHHDCIVAAIARQHDGASRCRCARQALGRPAGPAQRSGAGQDSPAQGRTGQGRRCAGRLRPRASPSAPATSPVASSTRRYTASCQSPLADVRGRARDRRRCDGRAQASASAWACTSRHMLPTDAVSVYAADTAGQRRAVACSARRRGARYLASTL